MADYIARNSEFYRTAYNPQFVETILVRTYLKFIKPRLTGGGGGRPRLLDFGCGTATPTSFFKGVGMDVYGVDFSPQEIAIAKTKFPDCADHFQVCAGVPSENDMFFDGNFDMLLAMQSLYYLTDTDTATRLRSLAKMLKPGAFVFISVIASSHYFYRLSEPVGDGLYKVPSGHGGIPTEQGHHFINFTESPSHLERKLSMFKPLFIGYYDQDMGEGSTKHWYFIGQKASI